MYYSISKSHLFIKIHLKKTCYRDNLRRGGMQILFMAKGSPRSLGGGGKSFQRLSLLLIFILSLYLKKENKQ